MTKIPEEEWTDQASVCIPRYMCKRCMFSCENCTNLISVWYCDSLSTAADIKAKTGYLPEVVAWCPTSNRWQTYFTAMGDFGTTKLHVNRYNSIKDFMASPRFRGVWKVWPNFNGWVKFTMDELVAGELTLWNIFSY